MTTEDFGDALGRELLTDARARFAVLRTTAERAAAQVDAAAFFATLDDEANSIAILMKHMGGNLRSRFTDFLTSDGEKPDRDRDREFERGEGDSRAAVEARWREGWDALESTLAALGPADLMRTVTVRGEAHSVVQAISRALAHAGQHVGQIVLLAKHGAGPAWRTLSIARGQSAEFNAATGKQPPSGPR